MPEVKKIYKHCQSCGMPLEQDSLKGGTEKDGSKSTKWCSLCYMNGAFTDKNCTLEQMKERVTNITKNLNLSEHHRKIAINAVSKLERWKK